MRVHSDAGSDSALRAQLGMLRAVRVFLLAIGSLVIPQLVFWISVREPVAIVGFASGLAGTLLLLLLTSSGSAGLVRAVRDTAPLPSRRWISPMLAAMGYRLAREEAASRIIDVVPLLDAKEAQAVDSKLWRQLYRYLARSSPDRKAVLFDVALLAGDPCAAPYLRAVLRATDLSDETRGQLVERMRHYEQRVLGA